MNNEEFCTMLKDYIDNQENEAIEAIGWLTENGYIVKRRYKGKVVGYNLTKKKYL